MGTRGHQPVVLKVLRQPGNEWHSGETLAAFEGRGMVRAFDYQPGAVLMERLRPGTLLVEWVRAGRDEEATEVLAGVLQQLSPSPSLSVKFPTVQDWGQGFQKYLESGDPQIPTSLVMNAQ